MCCMQPKRAAVRLQPATPQAWFQAHHHNAVPVTPSRFAGAYERLWAGDAVSVDSKLGDDGETLLEVSTRIKQLFSVRQPPNL